MSVQEPNLPYGGTTGERLKSFAVNTEMRERLNVLAGRYWEVATYGLIGILAAVLRFYNLGARAMHHDESLHGFFSWGFKNGLDDFFTFGTGNTDTYKHVPFMHGPFQFIGNGFMMWIFGDGNYQARILAATMGTGLVLLPFLFRGQIGRIGALAASAFIAFSPTLLYYSRFTREDIYTAFWTFGMVIFAWRYMASRENKWLYLTAGFLAGSFLTKETTFMHAAAFIFFFMYVFAGHIADKIRPEREARGLALVDPKLLAAIAAGVFVLALVALPIVGAFQIPLAVAVVGALAAVLAFVFAQYPAQTKPLQYVTLVVLSIPGGLLLAVLWPFAASWREKYQLDEMPPEANLIIVMGTLALPLYAAGVQLLLGKDWTNRAQDAGNSHVASAEQTLAVVSVLGLIVLSAAIGLAWRPKVWAIAAACFWVPFVLLSTTFFSNLPGFFSVIWGSLDYWLSQQDVRRGNQPDYYYFITIPVYEFLPLVLSLAAGMYYTIRGKARNAMFVGAGLLAILVLLLLPPGPDVQKVSSFHIILPFLITLIGIFSFDMDRLNRFLLFWLVFTGFALTVAGEKMPWLNVHIALPLAVLAGRFVGDMLESTDLRPELPKFDRLAPFAYVAIASALAVLIFVLFGPFSLASTGGWILALVAAISVYWAYTGYSRTTALQVAMAGAVCAVAVFSAHAAVLASWGHPSLPRTLVGDVAHRDHGDVPDELLVYTQTSGDIPVLAAQVDKAAKESGLGDKLPIVVDSVDGYTWPWAWYLRDYKSVSYTTISANYTPPQGAILFISKASATNVVTGDAYNEGVPYHHRRWFPEEYRGADGKYSSRNFFSDLFSTSALHKWFDYWVNRTPPNELGTVDGVAFFPKGYSQLTAPPAGPTVRTDGTQLVIGGNGSAKGQMSGVSDVVFDSIGNLYFADTNNNRIEKYDAQGNFQTVAGGFGGDVQMNQPWSMVVAPDGTVFVADTWNHKLVKLDKDLKKVKEWGVGGQTDVGGDPLKLFGPRDIALSPEGHVLIVDTGNNRVIEYTSDGDVVRQFGSKGTSGDPLQFNEPSSLAVAANGDIFVADFWNKRIVHFDKDLKSKGIINVDAWGSQAVTERGYLALLPDGRILATDPTHGKILAFGADGAPLASYDLPKEGAQAQARPVGIATDGTSVVVTDSIGNVARKIPLSEIIK